VDTLRDNWGAVEMGGDLPVVEPLFLYRSELEKSSLKSPFNIGQSS
jgi:hypothetical protein